MVGARNVDLPGLNCGLCGYRTCEEFGGQLAEAPELIRRCVHLSNDRGGQPVPPSAHATPRAVACRADCGACAGALTGTSMPVRQEALPWRDSLEREFDFYLEHFPEEPGPREIILPHNPIITRELQVEKGDILIGRPLGMSCGCPITHCGVAMEVDVRTGVIVWCVTGPLGPRQKGYKDLGYYIAEGYEGLVHQTRCELRVGMRYFFQPQMCMLQWRHSGLVNYLSRDRDHYQVRLEGLWIG
jgi:uncharacterized Fe-S cluster-containing protein